MRGKFKGALDVIATIAMIGAASAVIWASLLKPRVTVPSAGASSEAPVNYRPAYQPGERFGAVPGFDPKQSQRTLVMFLRSGCIYCTQSMEFYKRLAALPNRPRIVVMGPEPEATLKNYIDQYGLAADQVATALGPTLKFTGTPTLALVLSDGTVEQTWVGKLDENREGAVIAALGG